MAELEEDDIGNPVSENFEISQESDDTAALSPVQSDCPVAQTSDADDSKDIIEDGDGKDSSSSHSQTSSHETNGEIKEEDSFDRDRDLSQYSETKERIEDDYTNPTTEDDETEKADKNNETSNNDSDDEDKQAGPSKPRRIMLSSDEEDNIDIAPTATRNDSDSEGDEEHAEVGVGELMTNIFGEDSDDEKESEDAVHTQYHAEGNGPEGDDDEPRYVRDENDEDDGRVWDFDTMMRMKKAERRRPRRRRRDGSIDVGGAYDDQIRMLIDAMKSAAKEDRHSNMERRPALQKRKMLPHVKAMLIKHDLMEAVIDNGMMNVISEWLAPLPDKSLPALEIRTDLLKILQDFNRLEPGTLKQSGLGRAVMLLFKHPRETKENKALAARLISDWARPIFQLDTDFRSMTKDERIQRDYAQLPEAKRRRLDAGSESSDAEKEISEPRPGDKGFIMRARVPRPSQKDYVVRPKSNVEGQFRGATKNRSDSRFDRTQREFKERTKQQRTQRAVAGEPKPSGFQAVLQCDATGADFGGEIPMLSFNANETGCAYFTEPEDSCQDTFNNRTGCVKYYAVVPRGNCSFSEKAYHAQRGYPDPYSALIIFNDDGHSPVPMAGSKYADRVVIPVVMVSHACMTNMMDRFSVEKGYVIAIRAVPGYYDLVKYLIPLIAVVAFCFVVLCISLAVRVCRERRHLAKKRLSKRNLKKLPVKKFRKGDAEESCAICIDDFVEGEKLRVLPCSHAYHCKCIDPWLTKVRKVCPICKRKVLSSGESHSSDSDNDGRDSTSASASTMVYRENAPLLRNAEAFASISPSAPGQGVGPRRNMQDGRRPHLRVIITSPIDTPSPTPGTGYLTTNGEEVREVGGTSAISSRIGAFSEILRRTLRPYYQQIVNRSIRVPWRNATREPECEPGPNAQRPFVVDNNAFDESNEALNIEESPAADQHDPEPVCIFPSEEIVVNGSVISITSRLTYVDPELEVELSSDNQSNADTAGKVYTSEPIANVQAHINSFSTADGSIEYNLNSEAQALADNFGAAGSVQREHVRD